MLRVYRYLELNPVRANMVAYPREYQWSSYAFNGGGKASDWLKPHALYLALGRGPSERTEAYQALFKPSWIRKTLRGYGLPSILELVSATRAFEKSLRRRSRLRRRAAANARMNTRRLASRSICFEMNAYSEHPECSSNPFLLSNLKLLLFKCLIPLGLWAYLCIN